MRVLWVVAVAAIGACAGETSPVEGGPVAEAAEPAVEAEPAWTCASMCVEQWDCAATPPVWSWKFKSGKGPTAADAFRDLRGQCEFHLWDNLWCDAGDDKAHPALASLATSCAATAP